MVAGAGQTIPTWAGVFALVGGVTLAVPIVRLWLSGKITLVADAERRVADAVAVADARVKQAYADRDLVMIDRDSWRSAHGAEVEARRASEKAASVLLDQARLSATQVDITKELLSTLMSVVKRDRG